MPLTIVADTIVVLVSVSRRSPHYWFFRAFLDGRFRLALKSDILLEYEEMIGEHMMPRIARDVVSAMLAAPNVEIVERYYRWNLIADDPDDNKVVDCAVAPGADYVVSHDGHFAVLEAVPFPRVRVVGLEAFRALLVSRACSSSVSATPAPRVGRCVLVQALLERLAWIAE